MLEAVLEIFRYILTLFFGLFVSASFLKIQANRKNGVILCSFSLIVLALQGLLFLGTNVSQVTMFYPLITHLPLLLIFVFLFKKYLFSSVLAITTAYLCCQIPNWLSLIPPLLSLAAWVDDAVYAAALILTFALILRYVSPSLSGLFAKPAHSLISFGIVPVFYYIFDYSSTVYTELLYEGNPAAIEFAPFLLCICYMVFCAIYFKQYEEKQEVENRNRMIEIRQEQSEKEIAAIKRGEKVLALLRHDMRHFLNNISAYIESGQLEKARNYIGEITSAIEQTERKKYCSNAAVNMILSHYSYIMEENRIVFHYTLAIPEKLPISDMDITSILSNSLENAIHAVCELDPKNRLIELSITERFGKILLSLENTYETKPVFVDGVPVSGEKNHGFGTQSIRYTVEKRNGNCQFSATEEKFMLKIIF